MTNCNIFYTSKYKGKQWTNDMDQELPVKCTGYPPQTSGCYSAPWSDEQFAFPQLGSLRHDKS